jgi:prepilin peptidase CpaA
MSPESIIFLLVIMLMIGSLTDIRASRIPNLLTVPCALTAMTLHTFDSGMGGFLFSLAGLAVGFGLLTIPYLMNGLGAGDVKLMGAVGSFLGARATFEAFILIALTGGVYALALILVRRDIFKGFFSQKLIVLTSMVLLREYVPLQTESSGQKPRLKYGVAIAFGTITYLATKALGIKFFT